MPERVISVKMPSSLVKEMRQLTAKHHYLDLSEQLRSVVRQKCLSYTNPYTEELKRIRNDIASQSAAQTSKEQIIQELLRMLREGDR